MTSDSGTHSVDAQISVESAKSYWKDVPATVDGMLGGFPQVSRIDLRGSLIFLAKLRNLEHSGPSGKNPLLNRGVDCGAGIGRVTAGVMLKTCATVDIVEPIAKFADEARSLSDKSPGEGQIGNVYVCGLEDWKPDPSVKYDLMWHQWCLGHLNNHNLDAYLRRCKSILRPGGWIVVKENTSTGIDLYDDVDSSVTRTDASYRAAFEKAGLKLVRTELQKGFPPSLGLYPVRFYALQPKD